MTDDRLPLADLLTKAGDDDFLRGVAEAVLQMLVEADVEGLISAGRHLTSDVAVQDNITLLPLPPKTPRLNVMENVWQFMYDNRRSNRVFRDRDDIVAHCCYHWKRLTEQPRSIMRIGLRDWVHAS